MNKPTIAAVAIALVAFAGCASPRTGASAGAGRNGAAEESKPEGLPYGELHVADAQKYTVLPKIHSTPSAWDLKESFFLARLKGDVLIGFTIKPDGKPSAIAVVSGPDHELAKLVQGFVQRMTFTPAQIDGKPVSCEAEMPFTSR